MICYFSGVFAACFESVAGGYIREGSECGFLRRGRLMCFGEGTFKCWYFEMVMLNFRWENLSFKEKYSERKIYCEIFGRCRILRPC